MIAQKALMHDHDVTSGFREIVGENVKTDVDLFLTNGNWFISIVSRRDGNHGVYVVPIGYYKDDYLVYRCTVGNFVAMDVQDVSDFERLKDSDSLWSLISQETFWTEEDGIIDFYEDSTHRTETKAGAGIFEGGVNLRPFRSGGDSK